MPTLIRSLVVAAWTLAVPLSAAAAPLTADEVVAAVLERDPAVHAAAADLEAARGARAQSGFFFENPSLEAQTSVDASRYEASLLQPVSVTGEGLHARRAARLSVEVAEAGLARARLESAADARRLLAEAVVARQQAAIAAEAHELAIRLRVAVERELEVGEASELEARIARFAEAEAAEVRAAASGRETDALVALSALIGGPPEALELPDTPLAAMAPIEEIEAATERADLVAARARVEAAEAALGRERAGVMAPVGVGVFYEHEEGLDFGGPVLSVELPIWNRNQAGRAEARARLSAAEAGAAVLEGRVAAEQALTRRRLAELAATEALSVPSIDEFEAALRSVEAGYLAGELDLQDAVFLRNQILDGYASSLELAARIADARIDYLLAHGSEALLVGGTP